MLNGDDTSSYSDRQLKLRSKAIEHDLKKELESVKKGPKILLLGSGDSGKTTVLKQMKILHSAGFQQKERISYRQIIIKNIIESIQNLSLALDFLGVELGSEGNRFYLNQAIEAACDAVVLPVYVISAIKILWTDVGIRECFRRSNEFFLQDTAEYFLNDIDRFTDPNYIPTDLDILNARFRTSEITETKFEIDSLTYRIFDVGGQRSHRLFWAPYFEGDMHAIQFIASLSAFDQYLEDTGLGEDRENRMVDSIDLFRTICKNRMLAKVNFILFLNKVDLFEKKVALGKLKVYFPDYEPPTDGTKELRHASRFFKNKFFLCNTDKNRKIYTHYTTGTDTALMKSTISAVRDIVTRLALQASGIY